MALTTLEEMAVEVLRGNMAAAKALIDLVNEEISQGLYLPPVTKITCDLKKLRVVVFIPTHAPIGSNSTSYRNGTSQT